jgi:cysteine sulfinate desulfinase/cysteine desulfurase-like protein
VDLEELRKSITKETFLVSIQYANQEIGTAQDLKVFLRSAKKKMCFCIPMPHTALPGFPST